MEKHLHIISLNVPYPVDYGGVVDLFYKLPALQQQGIKIHLHCFEYGRGEQPVLNQYCEKVYYYKREKGVKAFSYLYPFIVSSRKNNEMLNRLAQDDYPILMEGIHCTYLLNDKRFTQRKCFVRLHNVEHIYYSYLFKNSSSLLKKTYFLLESQMLERYEKRIGGKAAFWSVIKKDAETYKKMGAVNVKFLPLFLPPWKVSATLGKGTFCLYHGDLSVGENEKAAIWLVKNIFHQLQIPFVIAGKNPPASLRRLIKKSVTTCLVENPDEKEMQDLISKAHINILPSFNITGIKLKLINALFNGRHCVVNQETVEGSGLEEACHVTSGADSFISVVRQLYDQPFGAEEIRAREQMLNNMFNNERNAKLVVDWVWE